MKLTPKHEGVIPKLTYLYQLSIRRETAENHAGFF
jgi:hypothetical protein